MRRRRSRRRAASGNYEHALLCQRALRLYLLAFRCLNGSAAQAMNSSVMSVSGRRASCAPACTQLFDSTILSQR